MNILFIGPYKQADEWGRKSKSILKGLQKTSHRITSRPVFLSTNIDGNAAIEQSEFITSDHYDILIQFALQPYVVYNGDVKKRIGIFNTETLPYDVPKGQLTKELLMDEVWTDGPSLQNKLQDTLQEYNPNITVRSIPPLLDIERLPENTASSIRSSDADLKDRFIFYYIGNVLEEKSGFREAYIAYMNTFNYTDNVAFIIAQDGAINTNQMNQVLESCDKSIGEIRNVNRKPVLKVVQSSGPSFSPQEKIALHVDGDCLVSPSYSISINSTVLESALYGGVPIINKGNSCYEWWREDNFWGIDSYEEFCLLPERPVPFRFTAAETWHKPIIKSLSHTMMNAYIDKFQRDKKIKANTGLRKYFSEASCSSLLEEEVK